MIPSFWGWEWGLVKGQRSWVMYDRDVEIKDTIPYFNLHVSGWYFPSLSVSERIQLFSLSLYLQGVVGTEETLALLHKFTDSFPGASVSTHCSLARLLEPKQHSLRSIFPFLSLGFSWCHSQLPRFNFSTIVCILPTTGHFWGLKHACLTEPFLSQLWHTWNFSTKYYFKHAWFGYPCPFSAHKTVT